jgi:hypothetical protein
MVEMESRVRNRPALFSTCLRRKHYGKNLQKLQFPYEFQGFKSFDMQIFYALVKDIQAVMGLARSHNYLILNPSVSQTFLHDRTDQKYIITQWSRVDLFTEHSDPSLIGAEQTVYGQSDYRNFMGIGDGGVSWGYTVTRSKDGDSYYVRWESTWRLTVAHPTDWVTEVESKFQIFGGTGKYLNAKGSGICRSKGTAQGETAKCEGEWEY